MDMLITEAVFHNDNMSLRIREILKEKGKTAEWLSEKLDLNPAQVSRFLTGARRANTDFLYAAASALNVSVSDLFERHQIPVKGYVGAGAELHFYGDDSDLDYIDAPPDSPITATAVKVEGMSMYPVYCHGDHLVYYERRYDVEEFIGKRMIVWLADDRYLVKTIERGSQNGLYTLTSFNAPPLYDVAVDMVSEIEWVKPA